MKTAIPFAVDDSTTEPSSDSAITITTPNASSRPGQTIRSGHQCPVSPVIEHRGEVDGEHVRDADAGGAEEPREQQRRAADRPDDERLQQAALRVARDDAERQEDREHDAEEERREHREPDQERAGERARVDVDVGGRRICSSSREDVVVREPEEEEERRPSAATTTAKTFRRTASRKPYSTMTATELSPSPLRRPRGRCPRAST